MSVCKLTGKKGKFVKSHIIPKSITRPGKAGNKFIQPAPTSVKKRYIKRSDSWYDKTIVIREGENYLSGIDSYTITELRDQGLLWTSDNVRESTSNLINGLVVVTFNNPAMIRKYFLSLLWRAAVSSLAEFKDIQLPSNKIELIRRIIIGEMNDDLSIFPTTLVQLTTRGPVHNFVPVKMKVCELDVYRFYMDGLIAHIHLTDPKLVVIKTPIPFEHPMFVGGKQTLVSQVDTSHSFQLANLEKHCEEYRYHSLG